MGDWNRIECELLVQDYMSMYEKEMRGEKYSKAAYRRNLLPKLNQRSEGSVEFKHQNVSAVLLEAGYPYIKGYKPACNYQSLLMDVVRDYLTKNENTVDEQSENLITSVEDVSEKIDWKSVLTHSPERLPVNKSQRVREFSPKKYNYAEREANNKRLGELGEEFVLNYERFRLTVAGREDLVKEIEWTSREKGDGAGYDIRSFDAVADRQLYIEVKTTNSGIYQPFYMSDNEVGFSEMYANQYALYRVYQFRDSPKIFTISGQLKDNVNLEPITYRASF
jgi:hypothetical protein